MPSDYPFGTFWYLIWYLLNTDLVQSDYPFATDNPFVPSDYPLVLCGYCFAALVLSGYSFAALVPYGDLFGTFWLPPLGPYDYPFDTF